MTSILCSTCYKTLENFKAYSNHKCKCNNEGDDDDTDADDADCNCADAIVNAYGNKNPELDDNYDNITNDDFIGDSFEYNSGNYDKNFEREQDEMNGNAYIAANITDKNNMVEVILDIESKSDDNSHATNDSEIVDNESIEEPAETDVINDIFTNSLLIYKQSIMNNEKPSLPNNMIAAIELLSLL